MESILKPIVMLVLFGAFFFGFKFIVLRKRNQQSQPTARIISERNAAFDTLLAAMLWMGMFGGRIHTPETIIGLDFSIVYVITAGVFYFISLQIHKSRNEKHSILKPNPDQPTA